MIEKTTPPDNTIDSEVQLYCQVIFKDGRPVLIKALSNYPNPNNPLLKAFDIEEAIAQEANKARLKNLEETHNDLGRIFNLNRVSGYDQKLWEYWKAIESEMAELRLDLTADKEQA